MAITTFIPELWSARLIAALEKAHVAANLVNREYEGDIKRQGDTVHINTLTNVAVRAYTKNGSITADTLTTADNQLKVDQANYFNFHVDDIDKVQAAGELVDKAMTNAAYGLSDVADKYILATMASGAATGNQIAKTALTSANVYQKIVEMRTLLDKANVPTAQRAIVIPPEAYGLLLQDARFTGNGGAQGEAAARNGLVGQVAGFEVYISNNLPYNSGDSSTTIVAAVPSATAYAEQITETEAYRVENAFADGVKGLMVFGAKVIDGNQIATLVATF